MTDWLSPETRARLAAGRAAQSAAQVADLGLFAPPPDNGSATSRKAADRVAPYCRGMRQRALEALAGARHGLTRLEMTTAAGMPENSCNARTRELLDAGWAHEQGERDGRAVVWITPDGERVLRDAQARAA